jgi:F1F0 ATPase subunit 2
MTAMLDTLCVIAVGFALGLLFYSGLWWTVRHAAEFRRPAPTLLGSALLRMAAVLGGFYAVAGGDGLRMLLCLLGLWLARLAVTWATRLPSPETSVKARHAP